MSSNAAAVRAHYEAADDDLALVAKISQALDGLGGPLTTAQLAGLDQFHVRGLAATVDLGKMLDIEPNSHVLDAGSGLGGPSRYLAETYGCRVTGVDLAASYVRIATMLAERTGLMNHVSYQVGDLLALDLPDHGFDIVYTQHVVMNISDRARLYRSLRRVLKQGGKFGFYDVLAADGKPEPLYPVPWAQSKDDSFLLTEAETRAALQQASLRPEVWNDVTADAVAWFGQQRPPAPGLNLSAVMGPRFAQMAANLARNLGDGRLRLVMARCAADA